MHNRPRRGGGRPISNWSGPLSRAHELAVQYGSGLVRSVALGHGVASNQPPACRPHCVVADTSRPRPVAVGASLTSTMLSLFVLPTLALRYGRFDATAATLAASVTGDRT